MGDIFNQMTGAMDGDSLSANPGKLDLAFEASAGQTPERVARMFKMQQETGLPQDVVDEHLDEIESRVSAEGFDSEKFRTESPTVASWIAENPQNAALIRDETDIWGSLENSVAAASNAWENERDSAERTALLKREFDGETLSPADAARRDKLSGDIMFRARNNQTETNFEYLTRVNTSGVFQMASSMREQIKGASTAGAIGGLLGAGGAIAIGQPELAPVMATQGMVLLGSTGATMAGGIHSYNMEAPMLFDDLRNMTDISGNKINPEDARNVARVAGVMISSVEVASGVAVASMIPGLKNVVGKAVGADAAKEAIKKQIKLAMTRPTTSAAIKSAAAAFIAAPTTEAMEEFVQAMISAGGREVAQAVSGQYFAPDDFVKDLEGAQQQAQDAFFGSIVAMGAPVAGSRLHSGIKAANEAKKNEAYYSAIGKTVSDSNANKILPEKMREVVERIVERGPIQEVFVDSTQFRTYFQNKGLDPREVAREIMGDTVEYDNAVKSDTPMRMPMADYATKIAPTEHNTFFQKEIRVNPDAMNSREAEEYHKEVEQMVKESTDSMKQVKDEVAARLVKIGYEQSTADTMAAQMGEFFKTQAANLGISDPMQLLERYGVDIKRGDNGLTQGADSGTMQYRQGENDGLDFTGTDAPIIPRTVSGLPARPSFAETTAIRTGISGEEGSGPLTVFRGESAPLQSRDFNKESLGYKSGAAPSARGVHFTTRRSLAAKHADGGQVNEYQLDIRNPKILDPKELEVAQDGLETFDDFYNWRESLRTQGYDGIIIDQTPLGGGMDIIAFDDFQVIQLGQTFNQGKEKGSITITPNKGVSITLNEDADLSTFLHESGHLYLEVLRDLSSTSGWEKLKQFLGQELEDGPQRAQMKEDAALIAKWLGAKDLNNLTVDQHEQFARGIEAYLMEGKAPSVELRTAFARFRAWLVALYKTTSALGVRLNPEVRAVFDRMFATKDAIDTAKREAEVIPVFTTAEEAGMSDTEFAAYSKLLTEASVKAQDDLQQKVMRQMQREQEAEWKRLRTEIRDSVAAQLATERVYTTLETLRDSKMSREALYQMFPEEYKSNTVMQALRNLDVYRAKEGLDPSLVADTNGYTSADEMVRDIIAATPFDQAVDQETDAQMKEKYGDILTDGTLAEKAREYVMGPGRAEVLEVELRALRKRQREARPVVSAVVGAQRANRRQGMGTLTTGTPSLAHVRQVARDTVAQMQIRYINLQSYLVAARNSSKGAIAAVHKGDYHIAAYHKQRELLNIELYREASRVKEEAAAMVKFMRKFEDSKTRTRLGLAGDFYLEQIDAILERFSFSNMTTKEASKRKALVQWAEERQAAGQTVTLPAEILNEAYRKPWKDMSFDELTGVVDAAKHIKHLATLKNKLFKSKAARELSATVSLIDETLAINARHPSKIERETRTPQDAVIRAVGGFFAAHRKIASLAHEMDGFVDGGPVWESIIWPLNEAAAIEAKMHEESNAKLNELFKPYITISEKVKTLATAVSMGAYNTGIYKKEFIPEINDSLTKVGRLMVALNWGNESNRSRIMEGYGWTADQVEAIMAPLTKEDWDFVQGVWDHFESYWPHVESLAKRVDGIAPKKIEAAVVMTPFGEYRGGYFPAKYDDRQSPKAYAHLAKEAADRAMHAAFIRSSTKHGERINRVQNVKQPIRLDFGVVTEALTETIHDITHYETLIDVNRIIGSKRVQEGMIAHFGHDALLQFRTALEDVAGGDVPSQTWVDKSLNWSRKGTTIVGMGWNLMTGLMQPLGLTQSIVRIGPKWVGKGISRWMTDATRMENTVKWIYSKSDIMQERSITQSREINEIRNQVSPTGLMGPIQDSYFYLIVKLQQTVDVPTWLGAYEKGMAEFNGDEAKAIATADQAVLSSQGGGQIKDRSAVQRGGPAQMLWTNFYSYFNTTFNLTAESYRKTKFSNPYEAGRFAADMLLLYTIPAILSMLIRDVLKGETEDDPEKLLKKMAQAQLSYMVGPVLLVREVGSALQGFNGYEGPAGAQLFAQSARLIKQGMQGEADEALFKAANRVAGTLFHYPAGQVQRIADGIAYDMERGTPNPLPLVVGPPRE